MRRVRRTILIVEDDPALRRLYRDALSFAGFGVCEAGNGYEALQCLEGYKIDLVILDLMLPMFSGHVVRAEIAAHAPNIPIIVVTGSPEQAPAGVAHVLRKPVTTDRLLAVVRKHLR